MRAAEFFEFLVPSEESRDPRFQAYIQRLAVIGLRIIGAVCLGGVAYMLGARLFLPGLTEWADPRLGLFITLLGLLALGTSFWSVTRRYARGIGALVGYFVALTQFWSMAPLIENDALGSFLFSGNVTGIMLVGIAALPLKPLQVLALGGAILSSYVVLVPHAVAGLTELPGLAAALVSETVLLCSALTGVVYRQRVLAYRARRSAERSFQELRDAQARLVVSENAHAQSRFAAALSHELNTPLGVLTSAFHTILEAHRKEDVLPRERIDGVMSQAEASGRASVTRIRKTLERMRLLTNLDRAEEQVLDLNDLCREAAASLSEEIARKADLALELEPIPKLRCRPQQLGAVVSNLLRNAAAAMEGRGRISLGSGTRDGWAYVEVRDNGRGITAERMKKLFEPSLEVEGSRVATTNWGLFVSRAIVVEHGGEIQIESTPGVGTIARVVLPLTPGGTGG